jgi:signal transduction histidine kinase
MKKILVIEDEHALRQDIIEMLQYEGYQMIGAENGAVGVQKARDYLPDLIICDIMMPELNGYEVLTELRKASFTATIPFIFLTAKTDKLDRRQGMEQGADDYLTKPFTVPELLKAITMRLEKRAAFDHLTEQRLEELRANIITAMPHELRTPLTLILGFSDLMLADSTLDLAEARDMLQHINTSAIRLYHLIENYLVYAQLEMGQNDPAFLDMLRHDTTENPHEVIQEAATQQAQIHKREADMVLDIAPTDQLAISSANLKKLVQELVDNACKFSPADTPIHVNAVVSGTLYTLTVNDHGIGMTEDQTRAMGAYMQFNRRLREQQGSGLGLIIVRRLAELHKGVFAITSTPGSDTTVTVKLPLA